MQLYRKVHLEDRLTAVRCTVCKGSWISAANYREWHAAQTPHGPENSEGLADVPVVKDERASICPECRAILIPSKVGHGHAFRIDRCGQCGGFWLDNQEWEALRSSGLHSDLHNIATTVWQGKVREESTKKTMRRIYEARFDGDTLKKLDEIHDWVHRHPRKQELLSYILDEDPSKA